MSELGSEILGQTTETSGGLESRFEIVRNSIMDKLASISVEAGYRNDVADVIRDIRIPNEITEYPEIGVVMGTRTIKGITSVRSLIDSECDIYIQAVVKADNSTNKAETALINAMESIHHDLCRAIHAIFITQINGSEPWNVKDGSFITDSFEAQGCGVVLATFKVHLRNMDGTFL